MRSKSYAEMRELGICTTCGKENPTPEYSKCPECRDRASRMRKDNYEYRVRIGVCVRCGKNKAEPHKTLCYECAGKEQDNYYKRGGKTNRQRILDRNRKQQLSARRLEVGICPKCGKRKSVNGGSCQVCRAKAKNYNDAHRDSIPRSERKSYGLCYTCGEKAIEGKAVCQKCYGKRLKGIQAALKKPDNSYFRSLETARIQGVKNRTGGAEWN